MKTPLPQSRNRNLPKPEAPADVVMPGRGAEMLPPGGPVMSGVERRQPWQQDRREPSPLARLARALLGLVLVAGMFGGFLYLYFRGVSTEGRQEMGVQELLAMIGAEVWENGTAELMPVAGIAEEEVMLLPMVLMEAKRKAGPRFPEVRIVTGDPPPGTGAATHQIVYFIGGEASVVLRMRLDPATGRMEYLGQKNRVLPERVGRPAEEVPVAEPAELDAGPAVDSEKVSEQP
ncbi:MAG: hypothetical protein RLZZ179_2241 [Verrucomicrobiota bacterium]|jgi:hypothetical protein